VTFVTVDIDYCSVRRSVTRSLLTPVYCRSCNSTLVGLPANLLHRLQSVLIAAARSIAGLRRSADITDTLASFHWLRAAEQIKFKLAVIVYGALH